jgi:hypothetical protein
LIAAGAAQLFERTPVDTRYRRVLGWTGEGMFEIAVNDGGAVWSDRPRDHDELRDAKSVSGATP